MMSRFLYLATPGGEANRSPTKMGITKNLKKRIYNLRSRHQSRLSTTDRLEYVAVFEGPAAELESEYQSRNQSHKVKGEDEWFAIPAGEIIDCLREDSRCEEIDPSSVSEDDGFCQLNVRVPAYLRTELKLHTIGTEKTIEEVVNQALHEHLDI